MTYCACGRPLHYTDPKTRRDVERLIKTQGDDIGVQIGDRRWLVQRHYIALHGAGPDIVTAKFPELLPNGMFLPFLHQSGGMLLDFNTMPEESRYRDQVFSHYEDDGLPRHFHIQTIKKALEDNSDACELSGIATDQDHANRLIRSLTIDQAHLDRLSDEKLNQPGIMCRFADDSMILVDGNHRFVKLTQMGIDHMAMWIVPETIWSKALIRMPTNWGR